MDYSKLQTGDLIFFRSKGVLPFLIRKFARISYNHVGVVVSNWGNLFLNEAVGRGILSQPLSNRIEGREKDILIRRLRQPINEKFYATRINSVLGKKYDFKGLIINQGILQIFGKWNGGDAGKEEGRFYCYEYCAWVYQELFHWWKINPKDLLNSPLFETIFEEK